MIETKIGRGIRIPKMLREIRKNGSPEPIFHMDKDRFFFMAEFPIHLVFAEDLKKKKTMEVTMEVTPEVTRLLSTMTRDLSRKEIQELLGLKDAEHFRKKYLLPAIDYGFIEMTIQDKPKSRFRGLGLLEKALC
ncbi:Fic family protein [Thermodesulfobacteriota bacterium]